MSRWVRRPSEQEQYQEHARRIRNRELARLPDDRRSASEQVVFSFPGAGTAGTVTGRYYPMTGGRIADVVGALPSGSTNSTFIVYKNGVAVVTLTWTSGVFSARPSSPVGLESDTDYLTCEWDVVGTGAADATIAVRWR